MKIVDAQNQILGRMATRIAKELILGEEIAVVNCSGAVISGRREIILDRYKQDQARGIPTKGPFFRRVPSRFVKRCIKRMLPKTARGVVALKKLKCFNGFPADMHDKPKLEVKAHAGTLKTLSVGEICKILGGKW